MTSAPCDRCLGFGQVEEPCTSRAHDGAPCEQPSHFVACPGVPGVPCPHRKDVVASQDAGVSSTQP